FCACLTAMFAITACSAYGQLYVGSLGDSRVKMFNPTTGAFQGQSAVLPATPEGMAIGPDGLLYVAVDGDLNQIRRVNPVTGADLGMFSQGGNMASPDGMVFGPGGDLFVVDGTLCNVRRFDGTTGAYEGIFAPR